MLLRIPGLLSPADVAGIRARIDAAGWVDGNVTSGHQSARAKYNLQLPKDSPAARECGELVLAALAKARCSFPPRCRDGSLSRLFNRYEPGMNFGNHVDGAIRAHTPTGRRIRTDISATLSSPAG